MSDRLLFEEEKPSLRQWGQFIKYKTELIGLKLWVTDSMQLAEPLTTGSLYTIYITLRVQ